MRDAAVSARETADRVAAIAHLDLPHHCLQLILNSHHGPRCESLHSLRRFLFFANEGKIRQRQDEAQVNQVGCLNFVTNAVVLWTTVYLQAIIKQLKKEGYPIHDDDLRHLSPARYEHINPYGNYEFNIGVEFSREKLRPLRTR